MNTLGPKSPGNRFARIGLLCLVVGLFGALDGCAGPQDPVKGTAPSETPSSTTPQTSVSIGWLRTIPDTVRIDTNIHVGQDGAVSVQSRRVHEANLVAICSNAPPSLDVASVDRVGVAAPDYPSDARTLYLYTDATQAKDRFRLVQRWLSGCNGNQGCCTTHLRTSSVGDQSLLEVTTDVGTGAGATGRWFRLIRVGNALLLTDSQDGSLPGPTLERDIRRQLRDLTPVLTDMKVFAS